MFKETALKVYIATVDDQHAVALPLSIPDAAFLFSGTGR